MPTITTLSDVVANKATMTLISIEWDTETLRTPNPQISVDFEWGDSWSFMDQSSNVGPYRRLGIAARNTNSLKEFRLTNYSFPDEPINLAESGILAFLEELKHNTSIEFMELDFCLVDETSFLTHFLLNNRNLSKLAFRSRSGTIVTPAQALAISSANLNLRWLDISRCSFGNDGSFEQIVRACANVKELQLECTTADQSSALANLLGDPAAMLHSLVVTLYGSRDVDKDMYAREIAEALVGNIKLKMIMIWTNYGLRKSEAGLNYFDKLLCDASSIENICNSNHTLEKIEAIRGLRPSRFTDECLKLNKTEDKQKVIRKKILQYYFVGDLTLLHSLACLFR